LKDTTILSDLKKFDIDKLITDILKLDDGDITNVIIRLLSDTLKLSDVYNKEWALERTYSDSLKLVDNYDRLWDIVRLYSDNLKLADVLTKSTSRILADDLKLDDGDITDIITRILSENLILSDNYSRIWDLARSYNDNLKLIDVGTKHTSRILPNEYLLLSAVLSKLPNKVLKNNLKIADAKVQLSVFKIIKMLTVYEEIFLEDVYSRQFYPSRTLPESLKLSDNYSRIWTLSRSYTDNLKLSPVLRNSISRELIDNLRLIDVLDAHREYGRILFGTIKLGDIKTLKTNKKLINSLLLNDEFIHTYITFLSLADALKLTSVWNYIKIRYGNLNENFKLNDDYIKLSISPDLMLFANNVIPSMLGAI
jgi:hypothetical protein